MNLTTIFIKLIWRKKSTLLGFLFVTLTLGLFVRFSYQEFIYLQAQNISHLSVFNEIILPFAGLTIISQLFISLLVSVQLVPNFYVSGQFSLLYQASVHPKRLLSSYVMTLLFFTSWPLLIFIVTCLVLVLSSNIDLARLGLTIIGLLIINTVISQIIFAVCIKSKRILLAIIQSILVLSIIFLAETGLKLFAINDLSTFSFSGLFFPFLSIREGIFVYADWVGYLGLIILSVSCCYYVICHQFKIFRNKAITYISFGIFTLIASGFISGQRDLTHNKRSSLSLAIKSKLLNTKHPLIVTAIIDEQTSRDEILRGFKIIQSELPSSALEFKSRQSLGPKLKHSGEYVEFKLGNLHQAVSYPFKQNVKIVFEAALHQMLLRKQQWITFIEGHGEASPLGNKPSDLSGLYQALTSMGWPVAVQDLTASPMISDNTGLIVIASSKQKWAYKEQQIILDYLNQGRELLLLIDPDSEMPESLESFIGISRHKGTLVDWNGFQNGTPHPAVVIVQSELIHPIVSSLNSLLAFPWSVGLKSSNDEHKQTIIYEPIVITHKDVWSEFNIDSEILTFDQGLKEVKQSFVIAMSRYDSAKKQKIIVVGDSHFVSDSAINNYSNKQFALNLVSWLTNSEIANEFLAELDNSIAPSRLTHWAMSWFFCLLLPIFIILFWYLTGLYRVMKINSTVNTNSVNR